MGIIRFLLAMVVLASHAGFWTDSIGARASVQVFFVLSGLYMAAVYTTKYRVAEHGARTFYLNRSLRLYPTYLFLLLLTAVVWYIAGDLIGNEEFIFNIFSEKSFSALWMWILAIILFGQDIVSVNESLHFLLPVRQSWSIGSELIFYATVPWILRKLRPRFYMTCFFALVTVKYAAVIYTGNDRLSYFFPLGNYGYFMLGCWLYCISLDPRVEKIKQDWPILKWGVLAALALVLLSVGESSFEGGVIKHLILIAFFSSAAILLFERTVHPVSGLLGNLSYGIYLNHFLILCLFRSIGLEGLVLLFSTMIGSVLLSYATERYLQKNVDRFRYSLIREKSASQTATNPPERPQYSQGASI